MKTPVLSRIVTCFQQWQDIAHWCRRDALFSAEIEWIIVNDCPGDPCPAAVKPLLESRGFRFVSPEFNLGRSQARNLGASIARGDWLEHIDGDDMPLPIELAPLQSPDYDVLEFPVMESPIPFAERNVFPEAASNSAVADTWSTFLGALAPFDVRPAASIWRKEFFQRLGGYDSRFENTEDLQLAIKAAAAGARVWRSARPKQGYYRRPGRDTFSRYRIEGLLRTCRWVRTGSFAATRKETERWEAKEIVYLWGHASMDVLRHWKEILGYLKWRSGF